MGFEKKYTQEEINQTLGKMNNQIEAFRNLYKQKPKFIIVSKELSILLNMQSHLMNQFEVIMLNEELLETNRVFGFSCFVSPVLNDLEFELR